MQNQHLLSKSQRRPEAEVEASASFEDLWFYTTSGETPTRNKRAKSDSLLEEEEEEEEGGTQLQTQGLMGAQSTAKLSKSLNAM